MNNSEQYLAKVELELRKTRTLSGELCSEFSNLPVDKQLAFAKAIEFSGCKGIAIGADLQIENVSDDDRILAVRLMCIKMFVDTGEPRWSSSMIERMVLGVLAAPGGGVGDVFRGLFVLLSETQSELTRQMVAFLKQIVILCFTNYRKSYESAEFGWLERAANQGFTPAQAYLALLCSPPGILPRYREAILTSLDHSSYRDEAVRMLSD